MFSALENMLGGCGGFCFSRKTWKIGVFERCQPKDGSTELLFVHTVLWKEEDVDCTPERFKASSPLTICAWKNLLESWGFHTFSRARVVVPFPETHIAPLKVEVGRLLGFFLGPSATVQGTIPKDR